MKRRHVIIGGGISGLALGWYLRKRFGDTAEICILEKSSRLGGWISTRECDGFLFEEGPRSCRTKGNGVFTLELVEALGLKDEVIEASGEAKQRYLYTNGNLQKVPNHLFAFLTSPLTRQILPAMAREWFVARSYQDDESIHSFISRRLNSKIAEGLFDPLCAGIYAGDISKLSMRSCFRELFQLEQEHGSLVTGGLKKLFQRNPPKEFSPFVEAMRKIPIFSFRQGMETLVKSLADELDGSLKLGCNVQQLAFKGNTIEVISDQGMVLADQLYLAVPAQVAASLLRPLNSEIAQKIAQIQANTVCVVNMGWKRKVLKYRGFGYLVPSREHEEVLGVVWDSCVFPQQSRSKDETRLTAILGGSHHPEMPFLHEVELKVMALNAIQKHLGIESPPDAIHVNVAYESIPQYLVGHVQNIISIESMLQDQFSGHIKLLGSSWHGVSVNDCIAEAQKTALINPLK